MLKIFRNAARNLKPAPPNAGPTQCEKFAAPQTVAAISVIAIKQLVAEVAEVEHQDECCCTTGAAIVRIASETRRQMSAGCEVFTEAYLLSAGDDVTRSYVIVTCNGRADEATEFRAGKVLVEVMSPGDRAGEVRDKLKRCLTLLSLIACLKGNGARYEAWTQLVENGPWQRESMQAGHFVVLLHGQALRL